MADVIIIGSGPAGVSAALYTARGGLETIVLSMGQSALNKADQIQNYYGFANPVSGKELAESGIEGAKKVGVQFIDTEVLSIGFEERLTVETTDKKYDTECILIATGVPRMVPRIKGIKELEGKGVSYCAICDAFFYKGKNVVVLGAGDYALHEIASLQPVVGSITLLTNGENPTIDIPEGIEVKTKKIRAINGNERVENIEFEDESTLPAEGLFVAYGVAGSTALAKKIGIMTDKNKIIVNEEMETNVPGIYAAGDCTGGLLQVSKAVYEGAKAGTEIVKKMNKKKRAQ